MNHSGHEKDCKQGGQEEEEGGDRDHCAAGGRLTGRMAIYNHTALKLKRFVFQT